VVDGNGWHMDGTMSGGHYDSKQVGTEALAGDEVGQHERYNRTTTNVPGPPTAPHGRHKRPVETPNPPRRCGWLKSSTRRVRRRHDRLTMSDGRIEAVSTSTTEAKRRTYLGHPHVSTSQCT
jgi:hypothetical protein